MKIDQKKIHKVKEFLQELSSSPLLLQQVVVVEEEEGRRAQFVFVSLRDERSDVREKVRLTLG